MEINIDYMQLDSRLDRHLVLDDAVVPSGSGVQGNTIPHVSNTGAKASLLRYNRSEEKVV